MLILIFLFVLTSVSCSDSDDDLGYNLNVGHAIDVFANYGDLSQVTQVVSADYEEEIQEPPEPFKEKNIRVFENATSNERTGDFVLKMDILLCETFEELLSVYFQNFSIEGTNKSWKAFMGDWMPSEIMRTFGIGYDLRMEDCCYVLLKLSKAHRNVKLDDLTYVTVKDYVDEAIEVLDVNNTSDIRRFMRSYGTHYIDSFVTGNFIYQVFKYKRGGFNLLRAYIRTYNGQERVNTDNLRFYFSSLFLKQIGDIRVASGNKTVEAWARRNLRDGQYLYSRPSLLRLHYSPTLAYKLNLLLDPGALLGMNLKTLRPLFKDRSKGQRYSEVVENDLQLWEINA